MVVVRCKLRCGGGLSRGVSGNGKYTVISSDGRDNWIRSSGRGCVEHRCGAKKSKSRVAVHPFPVSFKLPASGRMTTDTLVKLKTGWRVLVRNTMRTANILADTVRKNRLEGSSFEVHRPQVPVEVAASDRSTRRSLEA